MNSFQPQQHVNQILRMKQVIELTGLSRSKIYDMLDSNSPRYDSTFPQSIKLTQCSVGWLAREIDAWIESRIQQSRTFRY